MVTKYLGNGLTGTGNRTYRQVSRTKRVLVCWAQKRCVVCQRYLPKNQ